MYRFIDRLKPKKQRVGPLTVSKINKATFKCIQYVQHYYFNKEIESLKSNIISKILSSLLLFSVNDIIPVP